MTRSARLAIHFSTPWMGLRVLLDPALVAAVLGGVDRHDERAAEAVGEVVARDGHQPVVAVDEVEVVAVAELHPGGEHVRVHVLDPGDELAELARPARLADAVDEHAVHVLLGRGLLEGSRQDMNLDVLLDELLGELAHVARQAALDERRVFPGQDEDARHCSASSHMG